MKTPNIEGLATHDGPESWAVARKGDGQALAGVRAGRAIEPRNQGNRGADAVSICGRPHRQQRYRESLADPARSENLCMYGVLLCENREIPCSPAGVIARRAAQETLRR
jgi:hypothetical protein